MRRQDIIDTIDIITAFAVMVGIVAVVVLNFIDMIKWLDMNERESLIFFMSVLFFAGLFCIDLLRISLSKNPRNFFLWVLMIGFTLLWTASQITGWGMIFGLINI